MKKQIFIAALLLSVSFAASAQGIDNFKSKSPAERLKQLHVKLDSAFKLDAEKTKDVDDIFLNYFKAQDKRMEEIKENEGKVDKNALKIEKEKMIEERDTRLRAVLTEDQMRVWKEEIEPSLKAQRGKGAKQ